MVKSARRRRPAAKPAAPPPTLADMLTRAKKLAEDYLAWEAALPCDPEVLTWVREEILPGKFFDLSADPSHN
jgi:hypothetical protein